MGKVTQRKTGLLTGLFLLKRYHFIVVPKSLAREEFSITF